MSKKLLLALCLLSINNISFACQDDDVMEDVSSSASDVKPEEVLDAPMVHPEGRLTGSVTVPYRYQTEADFQQTLGYLKSNTDTNDTSSASDVAPQESLVSPEPVQPKPVVKAKKPAKKVKKPAAKKETKPKQDVNDTEHTVTMPVAPVKQDNPVVGNEPIMPANPAEKIELKSTLEPSKEQNNNVVPTHTDAVIAPKDALQSGVVISPQEPMQPNPAINAISEGSTVLEFKQGEVELSESHKTALLEVANKLKSQPNLILKLQSYGSVASSDVSEARRISLQRAIKVRKFLIENEVNPNNISVNAIDDGANQSNKVELKIEKNS